MNMSARLFCLFLLVLPFAQLTAANPNNGDTDFPNPPTTITIDNYDDSLAILISDLLNDFPTFTDEDYKQRLKELSGLIDYRLDPIVKERIIIRTETYRESTELLLGKSDIYFPIFEEHLAKYNIPHHLKYLAIVESHLNPVAKSVASAVGLWQFIPSSGKLFGLDITSYVDERSDTYKASDAAARLLNVLFKKYGDWALSMAAYNCGAGRVDKAIKLAGVSDYWVVRNYLPKETQKYVPFFMAMVYVGEFQSLHELKPVKMPQDYVLTDTIHIEGGVSIFDLANKLELGVDTLKFLNPAYRRNYIPKSTGGQIIVLPARVVAGLRGYQNAFKRVLSIQKDNPLRAVRRINNENDLKWLAKAHRCRIEDLLFWNELPANYRPYSGDLIAIRKYAAPTDVIVKKTRRIDAISMPALKVVGLDDNKKVKTSTVYLKVNKISGEVATVAGSDRVRAISRSEENTTNHNDNIVADDNFSAEATVPRAGSYDNAGGRRVSATAAAAAATPDSEALADRSRNRRFRNYGYVSAEPETEEDAIQGRPIESSYTEEKPALVSYEDNTTKTFVAGTSLVPANKLEEAKPITELKGRDLLMGNNNSVPKTEATIPAVKENTDNTSSGAQPMTDVVATKVFDRSRERNLRGTAAEAYMGAATPSEHANTTDAAPNYNYHKVQAGETLQSILAKYPQHNLQEILNENQLKSDTPLKEGQILKIRKD